MKIAIFGSKHQDKTQIEKLFGILIENNAEIYIQEKFGEYLKSELGLDYNIAGTICDKDFDVDIAVSIGGDGTFLRTASFIEKKNIPILGVNAGRLGFLADVGEKEIENTFADILSGNYRIEERTQLRLSTEHKNFEDFNYALNEIAVLKQDTASMITVHAYINDEYLTAYEADGLIVSTPTGSTAYSLSVESRNGSFLVSLDGRSDIMTSGTRLTIKKAEFTLKVAKRIGHTFYGTLRDKLMWGADPRNI